jgi:hypothetical protein
MLLLLSPAEQTIVHAKDWNRNTAISFILTYLGGKSPLGPVRPADNNNRAATTGKETKRQDKLLLEASAGGKRRSRGEKGKPALYNIPGNPAA